MVILSYDVFIDSQLENTITGGAEKWLWNTAFKLTCLLQSRVWQSSSHVPLWNIK